MKNYRNLIALVVPILFLSCGVPSSTVKNTSSDSLRLQAGEMAILAPDEKNNVNEQAVETKDYFFGVFAENMAVAAPVGHAFIAIGKGTPMVCSTDGSVTEAWGFYPKVKIEGGKSFFFGPVDGTVKTDIYTKIDHQVYKKITFTESLLVLAKIEEWKKKKYELTRTDCIGFVIDVCKALPGKMIVPDRMATETPDIYVKRFIQLNK